ncbi:hypothetical protein, partial [Hominenteromicrobium sp.]|uniref:hypothetical protein n=1 Tax=Hominenteromicrobium sp. TaxID=3073581 RepID=UPI003AB68EB4
DGRQRHGIAERKRRNVRGAGVQIRRYIIFREESIISNKERHIIKKEARSFWRSCALLGVLCAIFRDF